MNKQWTNKKGLKLFLAIFILATALDLVSAKLFYNKIQSFINNQPKEVKADAGIIFFGDATLDGKHLGEDSKNRAITAMNLYDKGRIKTIICVGGNSREIIAKPKNLMRNYLVSRGIAPESIIYDSVSFNTITNWEAAERIIAENNFSKVILISAPLHIYRIAHTLNFDEINVGFASYKYNPKSIGDYFILLKDIHHEWISLTLNKVLNDKLRNRIVFYVRDIKHKIKMLFMDE